MISDDSHSSNFGQVNNSNSESESDKDSLYFLSGQESSSGQEVSSSGPDGSTSEQEDSVSEQEDSSSGQEASSTLNAKNASSSSSEDSSSCQYSKGEASSTLNAKRQKSIEQKDDFEFLNSYKDEDFYSNEMEHPDTYDLYNDKHPYIDKRDDHPKDDDDDTSSSGSSTPVKLQIEIKEPEIECCNDHQLMTQEHSTESILLKNDDATDLSPVNNDENTKTVDALEDNETNHNVSVLESKKIHKERKTTNYVSNKKKEISKSEEKTIIKKPASLRKVSNKNINETPTESACQNPKSDNNLIDISTPLIHSEKSKKVSTYCNSNIIHKVKHIKKVTKSKKPVRKKLFQKPKDNKTLSQCGFFPMVSYYSELFTI